MKISIEKYLNKLVSLIKPLKVLLSINPKNNWLLLVLIFILFNIFLLSVGFIRFYKISSGEAFLTEGSPVRNIQTIDRGALSDTILLFETKRANFKSLKANRPRFIDPSL